MKTYTNNVPLSITKAFAAIFFGITAFLPNTGRALNSGDIAFVGYNSDGNDDFSIVALADIPANTEIYFRDDEWDGSAFNTGEDHLQWKSGASAISAGTIISFSAVNTSGRTVNIGSLADDINTDLGNSNEGLWAYHGTDRNTPTTFLAFISNEGTIGDSGNSFTSTGLTAGNTAVLIDGDEDIMEYTGTRTGKTADGFRTLIGDSANWTTQDGSGDQSADTTPPDVPFNTNSFTITQAVPDPDVPQSLPASSTNTISFTASWQQAANAAGYQLDVATNSSFTPPGNDAIDESFEGSFPPANWTQNSVDKSSTRATSGSYSAKLGAAGDYLITPLLASPGSLSFKSYVTSSDPDIVVEQSSDTAGPWTAVSESPFNGDTEHWNQRTVDLSSYSDIYVKFRKTGSGTLYMDDVSISDTSPGDFVAGYYNRAVDGSTTTSASVTGLTAKTTYYYRVRATNSLSVVSGNSSTQEVQTLDLAAPIAAAASWTNSTSFTSVWSTVSGATGYYLDVATNSDFSPSISGDLIISEMCDPANDFRTNRYIEIYNAGIDPIDLNGWELTAIANGSDAFTWTLSGSIASGEALTCGDDDAINFSPDFQGSWHEANNSWNGGNDDGAKLINASAAIVDIAYMQAADKSTYRISSNATASATYDENNWDNTSVDDVTNATPGYHTSDYPDRDAGDFVDGYENRDVANVTQMAVTGLVASTEYFYRVRAYNSSHTGANSNTQSVETAVSPEPSNHPTDFTASTITHRTIILDWTDSTGEYLPDRYLILGSKTGYSSINTPTDGMTYANDSDFSDGTFCSNVAYGVESVEISDLSPEEDYYFKIFPYAQSGSSIDYKTDGTVPHVLATTTTRPFEDMENHNQGSYTNGSVTLDSGNWLFSDALLGKIDTDKKGDQSSARIRNNGSLTMDFDVSEINSIFVESANFSDNTGGKYIVEKSINGGTSWSQIGDEVTCASSLTTNSFRVREVRSVRFRIQQTAGDRINIDNLRLTEFVPAPTVFRFH